MPQHFTPLTVGARWAQTWCVCARRPIKAAERCAAGGAEVVGVVTVVDRQEGASEAFAAAGLKLTPILTLADFK